MRSRPFVLALVLMTIVSSFSFGMWTRRDYTDENMRIVPELPAIDGLVLLNVDKHTTCMEHTCLPWSRFRYGISLDYRVDAASVTQQEVIDGFTVGLADWRAEVGERCANADPSFCDRLRFANFTRGNARVSLGFLNWLRGGLTVGIDARSE